MAVDNNGPFVGIRFQQPDGKRIRHALKLAIRHAFTAAVRKRERLRFTLTEPIDRLYIRAHGNSAFPELKLERLLYQGGMQRKRTGFWRGALTQGMGGSCQLLNRDRTSNWQFI